MYLITEYVRIHLGVYALIVLTHTKIREGEKMKKRKVGGREERSEYGGGNVTTTTTIVTVANRQRETIGGKRLFSLPDRHVTRVVKMSPGILVLIFKGGGWICDLHEGGQLHRLPRPCQ
jgi:hypothetical protein